MLSAPCLDTEMEGSREAVIHGGGDESKDAAGTGVDSLS
jgi:hypothetical protein